MRHMGGKGGLPQTHNTSRAAGRPTLPSQPLCFVANKLACHVIGQTVSVDWHKQDCYKRLAA